MSENNNFNEEFLNRARRRRSQEFNEYEELLADAEQNGTIPQDNNAEEFTQAEQDRYLAEQQSQALQQQAQAGNADSRSSSDQPFRQRASRREHAAQSVDSSQERQRDNTYSAAHAQDSATQNVSTQGTTPQQPATAPSTSARTEQLNSVHSGGSAATVENAFTSPGEKTKAAATAPGRWELGPQPKQRSLNFSMAALLLGIAAISAAFIPFLNLMGGPLLGLLAIIFGIIAIVKKSDGKPMTITGIVVGIIAIFFSLMFGTALVTAISNIANENIGKYSTNNTSIREYTPPQTGSTNR